MKEASITENYKYIVKKFIEEVNPNYQLNQKDFENIVSFLKNDEEDQDKQFVFNFEEFKFYKEVDMNVLKRFGIKDFSNFNYKDYKKMKAKHLAELKELRRKRKEK